MKHIIETTQLENSKSTLLIDLIKNDQQQFFIQINQNIHQGDEFQQTIKINPFLLSEFIEVLQNYQNKIPKAKSSISQQTKDKIQHHYFKGISIKDIALQLGLSNDMIEAVLRNRGIEIVSNEIPKFRKWRRKKKF